ncbi:HAD-IA family hydrolase [Streptomyces tubbatahanensis]|uniref:HAD-IA family hydrolase n=1 Tax=Streptomyces tubbatahanensis TaxID=2923272 RepID=A0ABY3XNK6_9ACTN|nr:HAD-IA family hydrolase [Streptomyces tubbatahanensis]UNS96006.1 HAD-IA family hydrolase [Streptomyces tubbatahanensis]
MKFDAPATLLFDNDGTLLSSMESVQRCWTAWAREYGIGAEDFAAVELHGRPAADIVGDLLPAARVPEALARIERLEVEDVPSGGVVALPGTVELLASLPEGSWAVVTSATRELAEARLRVVGIEAPLVIAADDITYGKPHPEPYLLAARKLGADPARCVVFEDAPAGLTAGRGAGMRTVALATTHAREELVADVVVEDLAAVAAQVTDAGVTVVAGD